MNIKLAHTKNFVIQHQSPIMLMKNVCYADERVVIVRVSSVQKFLGNLATGQLQVVVRGGEAVKFVGNFLQIPSIFSLTFMLETSRFNIISVDNLGDKLILLVG